MVDLRLVVDTPVEQLKKELFDASKWTFSDLGYTDEEIISNQSSINFGNYKLGWMAELAKETVWRKRTSVTFQTQVCYVSSLRKLDHFLMESMGPNFILENLKRSVIEDFILHISGKKPQTRIRYIANLNEIFSCWYDWELIDERGLKLIHRDDKPRDLAGRKPKFLNASTQVEISQAVATSAEERDSSRLTLCRMVTVLQEVGMRGNEVLALKKDCLSSDSQGDWYIRRLNLKNRKTHTVPISNDLRCVIRDQIEQTDRLEENLEKCGIKNDGGFLFVHSWREKIKPYSLRHLNQFLRKLGSELDLKDELGIKKYISSHVFRHTVGTNLINNGMSQLFVQKFLGHESPAMTAVYANIHDVTLRKELQKASAWMVDVKGNVYDQCEVLSEMDVKAPQAASLDAQWLKRHISTQCLPNGICTLPIKQSCPHANACLTCSSFRTDETFLPLHKEQLARCEEIIRISTNQNYVRQAELNQVVAANLQTIIKVLEADG